MELEAEVAKLKELNEELQKKQVGLFTFGHSFMSDSCFLFFYELNEIRFLSAITIMLTKSQPLFSS